MSQASATAGLLGELFQERTGVAHIAAVACVRPSVVRQAYDWYRVRRAIRGRRGVILAGKLSRLSCCRQFPRQAGGRR